jgi:lysophospholipase L1-like esterase
MTDINTALIPVPWLEQDSYDWHARHHAELALTREMRPQVVLIGDSITHFWGGLPNANNVNGPEAWQRLFGETPALNLGFGWDRTQNVLWRLRQGEFEGLHPKWVVVNIGTNNLTGTSHARASTPKEIVEAIAAIVDEIEQSSPESRIVLMAIFPRGAKPDSPLRAPIAETNRLLQKRIASDVRVTWLDIGSKFLAPDGSLPVAMMPDATHPSETGYGIWAEALSAIFGGNPLLSPEARMQ